MTSDKGCAVNTCMYLVADGVATVIQRRIDGSVNFDQTWEKYEKGFGNLESKSQF